MRMKSPISVIAAIAFLAAPLGQAVKLSEKRLIAINRAWDTISAREHA